jgi:hypothetical protein
MQYNTGLLVGRAFALANTPRAARSRLDPARELCELAAGDRMAILLAQSRFREFIAAAPAPTDERALEMLDAALALFDARCAA